MHQPMPSCLSKSPLAAQPRRDQKWWRLLALIPLLLLLATPLALADDTELTAEEEERLEAIERHTEKGWSAFRRGNYDEVLARMKRLRRYNPDLALADYLTAMVQERTGKLEDARKTASAASAKYEDHAALKALHLRLLLESGDVEGALAGAEAVLEKRADDLIGLAIRAMAHDERGRHKEALASYDKVLEIYNAKVRAGDGESVPPAAVPFVARAAERATWLSPNPADDLLRPAVKLLGRYVKSHPEDEDVRMQLAELYRSDTGPQGQSLARKRYREILKQNSEYADARVGQAWTDLVFWNQQGALQNLNRALVTNPKHVEALALRAAINVGNGDYDEARKSLDKALAINPTHKYARSVLAALHYIRGDKDDFAALEKEILEWDPTYGRLYRVVSELVGERQRRYDVAAEFARKALEIDDKDRFAYTLLGEALMNLGETDEALEKFDAGYKASKMYKDVRRDNWRNVLRDVIPNFEIIETEHFRIRMPRAEARIMRHYLPDLLEESYETLGKKYGVEATSPTYVDAFDRQDDFSVRSIGSAGLPALGVCFGRVVTLLGPTAMPIGSFSWSRTTWHEFAHVVTLQKSNGQVPRWLTEGLSVFEEGERRDRWGRDMERQLYNRWRNGRLLKMSEINSAFRGPDIMFAYFQGGLIAAHLQQARGFEVIPKMLERFGEDKSTEEVFQDVLGLELARYDEMFEAYVESIVGEYKIAPTWDEKSMDAFKERVKKKPDDAEAWIRLAWGYFQRNNGIDSGAALGKAKELAPNHPELVLLEGAMAARAGRDARAKERFEKVIALGSDDFNARLFLANRAMKTQTDAKPVIEHLQAAKKCFPRAVGKNSPYLQLAKIYRGEGDAKSALAELEAYAAISAEDYEVRKELLRAYVRTDDWESIARVCEEMVDISPFGADIRGGAEPDLELHRAWAQALEKLGKPKERLRELQVQVELVGLLPEESQAEAAQLGDRLALGRALLTVDPLDALEQAVAVLRLSPGNADALMLKRRAEEADSGR